MAAAEFHRLFRQHWDAGTGMPAGRRRALGSWTIKDFVDALADLNCKVDASTAERWVKGGNLTNRRANMLAILAVFFPAPADGGALHPDRQRMLEAWTSAQRRAGRPVSDAAAMQSAGAALLATPREPDAIGFVVVGDRLAIAPPAASDREAATLPLVAQLLPLIVEKLRELVETMGARLDNQRAWRGLPSAARGLFGALADATPEALPDRIGVLYHRTLSLGSFVEMDDRLGTTPDALSEPLEHDIRRALADALGSLAPWLRQFPSVLTADNARRDFLARPELFEAVRLQAEDARQVVAAAGEAGALSAEDAEETAAPADIAQRPGLQGEKAGYRVASTARHLVVTALGWKLSLGAALLTGAVGSDYATKSALVQRLGSFLARSETQAIRLVEGSPYDLVAVVRHGLALARDEAPAEGPLEPAGLAPAAPRREEEGEPPPDFNKDRVKEMILAGQAPPSEWVPWIEELDFTRTPLADLAPLAGLANLQLLTLARTQVTDLAPIAGIVSLRYLSVASTPVTDLSPIAHLTNLQHLTLNDTRVDDLMPIAGLTALNELFLVNTSVADFGPLAGLANLQMLSIISPLLVDLTPIAGLANLAMLSIQSSQVTDLAPLSGLANLHELMIGGTQAVDFLPFARLTNLQSLAIGGTPLVDLSPIAGLSKMGSLNLRDTRVSDLTPLAGLVNLQELDLTDTSVTDLAPVAGLERLSVRIGNRVFRPAEVARKGHSLRVADLLSKAGIGRR